MLVLTISEQFKIELVPYSSVVRFLWYFATITQPDIAYTVSYLGRFNNNSHIIHWTTVKHLFLLFKKN